MTTKEVLAAMFEKKAVLCMEFTGDTTQHRVYWLEPGRKLIRSDVAENVIAFPGIKPGGETLFKDDIAQTWRAAK